MKTYTVVATPTEQHGWWLLTVPQINRATQARNIPEIEPMAKDLISIMTGDEDLRIDVQFRIPRTVQSHMDEAVRLRENADVARREAAREWSQAARELRGRGLRLKDVATLMGISYQRVAQLVRD